MENDQEHEQEQVAASVSRLEKPLQNKKLQKLQKQYERRGIVYVSRIPPHMVRNSSDVSTYTFSRPNNLGRL